MRIAILDSHPIQYHVPWFRELSARCELQVLYAHQQSSAGQARAGYGVAFEWDVDLRSGYASRFMENVARDPGVHHFFGCDTPEIFDRVRRDRFDAAIVTGWYLKSFWQAVAACRLARVPVLVRGDSQLTSARSAARKLVKRAGYPLLLRSFDGFLSVGARNREYLLHFGVSPERIFMTPHTVDTARFAAVARDADARARLRAELGASDRDRIALQVGRLVDFKRPLDLLDAIVRIRERSSEEGSRWIAVYAGDGELRGKLELRAKGLDVRTHLLGFVNQSELPKLYAAADTLVLASEAAETWGLVVNEAMAAGLPAVVSDAAGCSPDMIDDGLTGKRFACGDIAGFAQALGRATDMRRDPAVAQALQRKTEAYSPRRAAEATLEAVRALQSMRGVPR